MDQQDSNSMSGALTGMAVSAASWWMRYDDATQRRLRNAGEDAKDALDLVHDMNSRGEVIRSRQPLVQDAQVGLALASPQPAAAAVVPSTTPAARPDLTPQMETAVAESTWPPEPGQYDDRGLVKRAGELTTMFLAMTLEEVRAFVQGLAQSRSPSREAKVQVFYAANSLVSAVSKLRRTRQQYEEGWSRLFSGASQSGSSAHEDPARAPMVVSAYGTNVQSIVPLRLSAGSAYANPNTDTAMRFRVIASASGAIPAATNLGSIRFGTEYKIRISDGSLAPVQPIVLVSSRQNLLYVDNISSTGFAIFNCAEIKAGAAVDAYIAVIAGVPTEG